MYVNGECFGLTPEEIRTMLGSPDVEPSKRRRRRFKLRLKPKVRRAAMALITAGVLVFFLHTLYCGPWNFGY